MSKTALILGVAFICIMTGIAIGSVGQLPKTCGDPYTASLPFKMFAVMAFPMLCGYIAGVGKS
jgi:hypothetical protein